MFEQRMNKLTSYFGTLHNKRAKRTNASFSAKWTTEIQNARLSKFPQRQHTQFRCRGEQTACARLNAAAWHEGRHLQRMAQCYKQETKRVIITKYEVYGRMHCWNKIWLLKFPKGHTVAGAVDNRRYVRNWAQQLNAKVDIFREWRSPTSKTTRVTITKFEVNGITHYWDNKIRPRRADSLPAIEFGSLTRRSTSSWKFDSVLLNTFHWIFDWPRLSTPLPHLRTRTSHTRPHSHPTASRYESQHEFFGCGGRGSLPTQRLALGEAPFPPLP